MKLNKFNHIFLTAVISGFLILASCGEEKKKDPKPKVISKKISGQTKPSAVAKKETPPKATAKKAASKTPPLPRKEILVPEAVKSPAKKEYRFISMGKVDPFQPLFKKEKSAVSKRTRKKIKKRKPQTPLEKIDVSQLKLVAIMLAPSGNKALVEQASGRGYIIGKGTYIGLNSGIIEKIEKNKVIIAEQIVDMFGNPSPRKKELILRKTSGDF